MQRIMLCNVTVQRVVLRVTLCRGLLECNVTVERAAGGSVQCGDLETNCCFHSNV